MNVNFNSVDNLYLNKNSSKNMKRDNTETRFDELLDESNHFEYQNSKSSQLKDDHLYSRNGNYGDENSDCAFDDENIDLRNNSNIEFHHANVNKTDTKDVKIEKDYGEHSEDMEDDENFENLKSLIYILDLIYFDSDKSRNVFDFKKIPNSVSEKFYNSNKIDKGNLSKVLSFIGCNETKIKNENISNGDVLNQIFNSAENFKMVLRNEIIKFEEREFDNPILKILDSEVFLNDKELLKNLKNEITNKLNASIFVHDNSNKLSQSTTEEFRNSINEVVNFRSMNGTINNSTRDSNILKEIYDDTGLNTNIENYYFDIIRNGDLQDVSFEKVIDANNVSKFQREFIDNIKYMSNNGKSEMSIQITPEHLGKIDIKYEVIKDSVRIIIRAEQSEAMKLIDNTITQIKNMVRENHQIDLRNIHVDIGQFDFDSNSKNPNSNNANDNSQKNNNIKIETNRVLDEGEDLQTGVLV